MKNKSQVALIDDQHVRPRTWYTRFRRYVTVAWCWLKSVDPPPLEVTKLNKRHLKITEDVKPPLGVIDNAIENLLPLENEQVQLQSVLASSTEVETIDLLFLGLSGTGITTTANKLFNITNHQVETSRNDIEIVEISNHNATQRSFDLRTLDIPGFCKGYTIDEDAELVLAINEYIKISLPNKIPNLTFIISRFDDERFEGEASEFSKMLTSISHSQMHWTNAQYSNVVLVLTHAAKVKDNVSKKILKFQEVFHCIFPKMGERSVSCAVIENNDEKNFVDVLLAQSSLPCFDKLNNFKQHLKQLQTSEVVNTSQELTVQRTNIKTMLPSNKREVNVLIDKLLQGVHYEPLNCRSSTEDNMTYKFCSYFPSYQPCKEDRKCGQNHNRTKLLPYMKLLMADGVTELPVSEVNIGNKLFNKEMNHVIITAIKKVETDRSSFCPYAGIYFYTNSDYDDDDQNCQTVFTYVGRNKLKREKLDWSQILPDKKETLFELEVNSGVSLNDTFITNGYVTFAAVEKQKHNK